MKTDYITHTLAELGNETRLAIFRLLVQFGNEGMTIGDIGKQLDIPASTLGFHLRRLVNVGLVRQHKEGRQVFCYPQLKILTQVLRDLQAECCQRQKL